MADTDPFKRFDDAKRYGTESHVAEDFLEAQLFEARTGVSADLLYGRFWRRGFSNVFFGLVVLLTPPGWGSIFVGAVAGALLGLLVGPIVEGFVSLGADASNELFEWVVVSTVAVADGVMMLWLMRGRLAVLSRGGGTSKLLSLARVMHPYLDLESFVRERSDSELYLEFTLRGGAEVRSLMETNLDRVEQLELAAKLGSGTDERAVSELVAWLGEENAKVVDGELLIRIEDISARWGRIEEIFDRVLGALAAGRNDTLAATTPSALRLERSWAVPHSPPERGSIRGLHNRLALESGLVERWRQWLPGARNRQLVASVVPVLLWPAVFVSGALILPWSPTGIAQLLLVGTAVWLRPAVFGVSILRDERLPREPGDPKPAEALLRLVDPELNHLALREELLLDRGFDAFLYRAPEEPPHRTEHNAGAGTSSTDVTTRPSDIVGLVLRQRRDGDEIEWGFRIPVEPTPALEQLDELDVRGPLLDADDVATTLWPALAFYAEAHGEPIGYRVSPASATGPTTSSHTL